MERGRRIIFLLATSMVVTLFCQTGWAAGNDAKKQQEQKEEKDIWTEGAPRRPRRPQLKLTEEEINRIMKRLKETDPKKAKELEDLRKQDPNQFRLQLSMHGGEEFGKIVSERINAWREKRRADFLDWLKKNYPKVASELSKLKGKTDLYLKKFELVRKEYWRIFEEEGRNPGLAEVLKEDLRLKKRRDDLLRRIKCSTNDKDKKKLTDQLKDVVGKRYDLIVRRKEIAYERFINRLEQLKKELKKSREDIATWRDEKTKADNVKKRMGDLVAGRPFKWD